MKGFGDFRRVAVIVVPTEEEYARRQESCKNDIDKDNTETEQNEMKGNNANCGPSSSVWTGHHRVCRILSTHYYHEYSDRVFYQSYSSPEVGRGICT